MGIPCEVGSVTNLLPTMKFRIFKLLNLLGKNSWLLNLKNYARKERGLADQPVPFPCCFGRSIDEVFKTVRSAIDRTPRRAQRN